MLVSIAVYLYYLYLYLWELGFGDIYGRPAGVEGNSDNWEIKRFVLETVADGGLAAGN